MSHQTRSDRAQHIQTADRRTDVWGSFDGTTQRSIRRQHVELIAGGLLVVAVLAAARNRRRRHSRSREAHELDGPTAAQDRVDVSPAQLGPEPDSTGLDDCGDQFSTDEFNREGDVRPGPVTHYQAPTYEVLVKVIGHVECDGRDIRGLPLEILAILACLRTRSMLNSDLVRNTLDRDDNAGTVPNNLSRLRKLLDNAPDGSELLTKAVGGRYADGSFELSPLVATDIDLLRHRYEAADDLSSTEAIEVLRAGLPLLRGPLFRARRGYDWAVPEGIVAQAQTTIIDYCTRLAHLAAEAGDLALVYESICLGGNAIDDPVVELSMRQVEQHYADLSGDQTLIESARAAQHRFNAALRS